MASNARGTGFAPDHSTIVLLLIDVINDFAFPEARALLRTAVPAAKKIAAMKAKLSRKGIPAIYVNDNFGRWRSDFNSQVEHCLAEGCLGREIAQMLKPAEDDYFVLKPKHSGFFSTTLDVLLQHLGAKSLILCGFAGDICVLYTANDAYMRDYRLIVPEDCIASETLESNNNALREMERILKVKTSSSERLRFTRQTEN